MPAQHASELTPEEVRIAKRFQRYCNMQREEILELRAELYRTQALLGSFKEALEICKAMAK